MSSFDTEQAFKDLGNAIIRGDAATVDSTVRIALGEGVHASLIINDGMIPGMDVVRRTVSHQPVLRTRGADLRPGHEGRHGHPAPYPG